MNKVKFLLLLCICMPINAWSEAKALNDDYVLQKLGEFEEAFAQEKLVFFEKNFADDATLTFHTKQQESEETEQLSRQDILAGKLFEPQVNPDGVLPSKETDIVEDLELSSKKIDYYNDKTQALLVYSMTPKEKSPLGESFTTETEMLFQVVKDEIKIMKVIVHVYL